MRALLFGRFYIFLFHVARNFSCTPQDGPRSAHTTTLWRKCSKRTLSILHCCHTFCSRRHNANYNFFSKDVYSFGLLLWFVQTPHFIITVALLHPVFLICRELITEQKPYSNIRSLKQLFQAVCIDKKRPDIPEECPLSLKTLITSCWHPNPSTLRSSPRMPFWKHSNFQFSLLSLSLSLSHYLQRKGPRLDRY